MSITENTTKLLKFTSEKFEKGELNNDSLVQLIELAGNYLNIESIPNYAKQNNLSYNGVKKFRTIVELFNIKFVIDND
jgi:hypothetical protein